ncbi:imidazole glycerol phosphate synthase subunit HisF [Lactococcus allomyrinae]|uniref:Imidazole glycerol phosphate synthase subunit HisF n=1 Tax=Lactococcus allomyrinae TaxID=2419773 RepID=A0A387BGD7_9LACT|nr:imidazole glycerol phosphate synthase subunit HisF [Lactococcus allomyrinae]AYG00186.1 imidazole glycerol phosphate synthase subunit HisF [Lactococcus allomyrinae]
MLSKRIIPCLDIKDGKVVKGTNFIGLKELGEPVEFAKEYEKQCADEIIFLDITATYENREIIGDIISHAARVLSIPLTVGGGIHTIDDFQKILSKGADKVSINSAAVKDPKLITQAAEKFGNQCVVVAIDAKINSAGSYDVYIKGGRENTGLDLVRWVKQCEQLGAGEILLTSMDKDGTKSGYDINMLNIVCESVNIPVIASGGCGSVEDIVNVFKETRSDAALVASLFHYKEITIDEVKEALIKNKVPARRLSMRT